MAKQFSSCTYNKIPKSPCKETKPESAAFYYCDLLIHRDRGISKIVMVWVDYRPIQVFSKGNPSPSSPTHL